MNRLLLIGRIVREIELKEVGAERYQVINNVLAVPRTYAKGQGDQTDFIPFVVWNQRAELIEKYCQKGDLIGLDGHVQTRQYEGKDGETHYITEMLVEQVQLLPNKREEK